MNTSTIIDDFREKLDEIKYEIRSYGYSFFEHPELEALIRLARNDYFEKYSQIDPHAPTHKFSYFDLGEKKYWKKLAIGSSNGTGAPYAQFLVTTYVTDRGGLTHLQLLFNLLFILRNLMIGLPRDFGAEPQRDKYWNASRVHTYPAGGGFMLGHTDTHFLEQIGRRRTEHELLINDSEFHVTHVSCPLSLRGQDFEHGGFWIKDRRIGQKLFLEKCGDQLNKLLIYDGYCEHGIDSVDPDKLLDLSTTSGRTTCLSNLYAFD